MVHFSQAMSVLMVFFIMISIGSDRGMQLFVRFIENEVISFDAFDVAPDATIGDLKKLIQGQKPLDPEWSIIKFSVAGDELKYVSDDVELSDLGISAQAEIQCKIIHGTTHEHSILETLLQAPTMIVSKDGNTKFVLQKDENLVLYHRKNKDAEWKQTWSANCAKENPKDCFLKMQGDGNLCLYHDGGCYWANHKHGNHGHNSIIVNNDGTVIQKSGTRGTTVWKIP